MLVGKPPARKEADLGPTRPAALGSPRATAILFAVWLAAFTLSLDDVIRRTAYSPLMVAGAQGAADYPRLVGFKAGLAVEPSGLAPGDRLVAVDGHDLRGARALDWIAASRAGTAPTSGSTSGSSATASSGAPTSALAAIAPTGRDWWRRCCSRAASPSC